MNTEDSPSVEAPDLLPCPFCGDKLMQLVPIDGEPYFKHLLNACILATYGFGDPLVLLACDAKAWNQRPPVATVQEGAKVAELTDAQIDEIAQRHPMVIVGLAGRFSALDKVGLHGCIREVIAADRQLRSPAQPDMDAAWAAYQSYPIDYFEDSDDEHRKAVEAAVRAALRSSEATRVGEHNGGDYDMRHSNGGKR